MRFALILWLFFVAPLAAQTKNPADYQNIHLEPNRLKEMKAHIDVLEKDPSFGAYLLRAEIYLKYQQDRSAAIQFRLFSVESNVKQTETQRKRLGLGEELTTEEISEKFTELMSQHQDMVEVLKPPKPESVLQQCLSDYESIVKEQNSFKQNLEDIKQEIKLPADQRTKTLSIGKTINSLADDWLTKLEHNEKSDKLEKKGVIRPGYIRSHKILSWSLDPKTMSYLVLVSIESQMPKYEDSPVIMNYVVTIHYSKISDFGPLLKDSYKEIEQAVK